MFNFEMVINGDNRVAVLSTGDVDYFVQLGSDGTSRSKAITFNFEIAGY